MDSFDFLYNDNPKSESPEIEEKKGIVGGNPTQEELEEAFDRLFREHREEADR